MQNLKRIIKNYFGFSTTETKGFIVILFFMILLLLTPLLIDFQVNTTSSDAENQALLNKTLKDIIEEPKITQRFNQPKFHTQKKYNSKPPLPTYHLFHFDPNTVNKSQLEALGLKYYVVKNILKYRSKGGYFKKREDFKTIYGLSNKKYNELAPYITIKTMSSNHKSDSSTKKLKPKTSFYTAKKSIQVFNINLAEPKDLIQVKGIGKYYANKIIRFRDALGGFYSKEQIRDTYNLPQEAADELLKYVMIKDEDLKKININTAEAKQLVKHPYISWNLANAIVKYRKQHGPFSMMESLKKIKILKEDTFNNLKHYLML